MSSFTINHDPLNNECVIHKTVVVRGKKFVFEYTAADQELIGEVFKAACTNIERMIQEQRSSIKEEASLAEMVEINQKTGQYDPPFNNPLVKEHAPTYEELVQCIKDAESALRDAEGVGLQHVFDAWGAWSDKRSDTASTSECIIRKILGDEK